MAPLRGPRNSRGICLVLPPTRLQRLEDGLEVVNPPHLAIYSPLIEGPPNEGFKEMVGIATHHTLIRLSPRNVVKEELVRVGSLQVVWEEALGRGLQSRGSLPHPSS